MTSDTPYSHQPAKAFWHSAISERSMLDIADMWTPKFNIRTRDNIATYGSCFAQHIGTALDSRGYTWLRSEPKVIGMSAENLKRHGYELFSSRTGNIYTTSQLHQWTEWANNPAAMPAEIWQDGARFFDPFRPNIEPNGFASEEEVMQLRSATCYAFGSSIKNAKYLVFTLGLTERWRHKTGQYEYPMCPGTVAGSFDSAQHEFSNMGHGDIKDSLEKAIVNLRKINAELRIILTVSPVQLAATATRDHVLVASSHAKAMLRAVAGEMAIANDFIDYFPSYEIINNPIFRGTLLKPSLRTVNATGVRIVMDTFFNALQTKFGNRPSMAHSPKRTLLSNNDDVVCEEELLRAFGDHT